MVIETLLLLISTVACLMALALVPAVVLRPNATADLRYWGWGSILIAASWFVESLGAALPLDSTILASGFLVLGVGLFAQATCIGPDGSGKALNPLWPVGLLLAAHLVVMVWIALTPIRPVVVAAIVTWVVWRTAVQSWRTRGIGQRVMAGAFTLIGLFFIAEALFHYLITDRFAGGDMMEFVRVLFEMALVVFLTTSFLAGRLLQELSAPRSPDPLIEDSVAGCLNRFSIEARLRGEWMRCGARGLPLSVLMIDIDRFKTINDTQGHPAGDAAMRQIAAVMAERIRSADSLGRYGGDEFLVVLPAAGARQAARVAGRIQLALARTAEPLPEAGSRPTVSIGLAEAQGDDRPGMLVERADRALYSAKSQGGNQIVTAAARLAAPPPAVEMVE